MATKRQKRPWRRCSSCYGVAHWHDEAWVCDACGDEWFPEHAVRYDPPGQCRAVGCEFPVHGNEHPHGIPLGGEK